MNSPLAILPATPSDNFSDLLWKNLCRQLEPAAQEISDFAFRRGLTFQASSRWPSASVVKRSGIRVHSLSLQLAEAYVEAKPVCWNLIEQTWTGAWIFYYKPLNVGILAQYSSEQLRNAAAIAEIIGAFENRFRIGN